ncbi:hypothetical protein CVT25_014943 [Psilocybe cyanescens]|uniref:Peptidase S1 domain-containing protein n=1 Tax=Psilocybe cyanescens TaxID=93625 RepID=A0A409XI35_PSICY|nr:hypothetical protein CVT25_014943 [Psilocybe cyanescens]
MHRHLSSLRSKNFVSRKRCLATVSSSIIAQPPFPEPLRKEFPETVPPLLDYRILQATSKPGRTTLTKIIKEYINTSGTVLDLSLPYESRPSESRRPDFANATDSCKNVVTVAHCAQVGSEHKITLSSGFALNIEDSKSKGETIIITCAHTLEEIRQSPLLASASATSKKYTGSFIVTGSGPSVEVYPVSRVVSALPRSDLILLSCPLPVDAINSLPISPYPAHKDTAIRAHFVAQEKPDDSGWMPWIGGTWGKWHHGKVLGYRDFAGRETEPGTYDALSHLLFTPLPTAGSSGGPIVDEESGAVIGVMLGTRMDNRVEGVRGWGVPSESVFEMFSLPGLEGKSS